MYLVDGKARSEQPQTQTDDGTAPALLDSLGARLLHARVHQQLLGDGDQPKVRVDRFVLERELGFGGMGTIYAGFDEELQRRVALKFLHKTSDDSNDERRLLREAQALAQLSHPNVVPIYDVGYHEGRVWLAMEYVPGQTLRAWAEDGPRPRAELLERWIAAGQGLAAVHEVGLIHRDIKPDNVMIGDDGRVRVIDFGLVRTLDGAVDGLSVSGLSSHAQWSKSLTIENSFVGTPAYAAPEQLEGRFVDFRSDQYSFCASLWEALCGQRPSRRLRERGGLVPLPEGVRLPARLRRVLSRGLAVEACDRFADLPALLAALAPPRRRWVAPLGVAALVCAAALGTALALRVSPEPAVALVDPCMEAGAPIERVWTADTRAQLEAGLPPATADHAAQLLDRWAQDWRTSARQSCEDVHVRHQLSAASLDRRGVCLERALADFSSLNEAAGAGQITSRQALVEWLGRLESPKLCLSEAVLSSELEAPPTEHAKAIAELRRQLLRVAAGLDERSVSARLDVMARLETRAAEIGWRPLLAEIAAVHGRLHMVAGDAAAARERLGTALDLAEATGDIALEAEVWSLINQIERDFEFDHERAEWAWQREAAVFEGHEASDRQRARLLVDHGLGLGLKGHSEPAEAALREAVTLLEGAGPLAAWEHARALRALGVLIMDTDAPAQALELFARARGLELGPLPKHAADARVHVGADTLLNEGIAEYMAGDLRGAEATMERALAAAIEEVGPRGQLVARIHTVFAAIYEGLELPDELREHAQLADQISLVAVGPTHPMRVDVLSAVAKVALDDGRLDAAIDAYTTALMILEGIKPADSLPVALAEFNLADAIRQNGETRRARALLDHALPVLERELPSDHPWLEEAHHAAESFTSE